MKCKHPSKRRYVWRVGGGDVETWFDCASWEESNAIVCNQCGEWLSLGPSDEHASEQVEIEIRLAELLAQTECEWEPCGAKDEQFDLYVDIFATDEPPQQFRRPGPRSPIEIMVDRACGITREGGES